MTNRPWHNLSPAQQKAAEHLNGPLLIAAGAGSGKTLTLTSRLFHLLRSGIRPEQIIAITFTNKAAQEMRNRVQFFLDTEQDTTLPKLDALFIGTFHSLGAKILKAEASRVHRTARFTIFDEDDALSALKKVLTALNLPKDTYNPVKILGRISHCKNELRTARNLPTTTKMDQNFVSIFEGYEQFLRDNNAFDFDDLITKVVWVLEQFPDRLAMYQQQWQHILVDEFQDVNTSQYRVVKLLAHAHQNLFVIGDDAQSIYSFRGSDFRNFLNFEKDWPKANVILLEENYRSTQTIIRAASALIAHNTLQKPKDLWTKNTEGAPLAVSAYTNDEAEAWGVTEKIRTLLRQGKKLGGITILYRTNAQSRALEQALIQDRIPYEIFGGLKFYARKEIKDIVAGLRYAFNPQDLLSSERIGKTFTKAVTQNILTALPRLAGNLTLPELIQFFIEETNYVAYLERHYKNMPERLENIQELIHFAGTFKDSQDFLERIALLSSSDGRPKLQKEAVKLMTIHMAKGLEFNQVFLVGVNEHLIPHERSLLKNEDVEEERRLMYVAMTRAKENLYLSFFDLPSRFLGELPPELIEFTKVSSYGSESKDWDDEAIYLD